MSFNDPSTPFTKALEWAGGGVGAACVVVGAAIGGFVGMVQGADETTKTCIQHADPTDIFSKCTNYLVQPDGMALINTAAGGVAIGATVGAVLVRVALARRTQAQQ